MPDNFFKNIMKEKLVYRKKNAYSYATKLFASNYFTIEYTITNIKYIYFPYKSYSAVNYKQSTNECFLILLVDQERPIVSFPGADDYIYLPKKKSCFPKCYFKKYENKYLVGFNDFSRIVKNENECLDICLQYIDWCRSFEFKKSSKLCVISKKYDINHQALTKDTDFRFYQLICQKSNPINICFEKFKDKHLLGYNTLILDDKTENECLESCLTANFVCR